MAIRGSTRTHYYILGVDEESTAEGIAFAYWSQRTRIAPLRDSPEKIALIQSLRRAYYVLSKHRVEYDAKLRTRTWVKEDVARHQEADMEELIRRFQSLSLDDTIGPPGFGGYSAMPRVKGRKSFPIWMRQGTSSGQRGLLR